MTTYEVGDTATVAIKVYDSTGVLADLGGGVPTVTVTKPDGSTAAATSTKTATGCYQGALTTALAGRYRFTFTGTGANSGGLPWTDVVDVWPADPRLIIPLADAKAALNIGQSVSTYDDELRLYIATVTEVIEDITGPILVEAGHTWTTSGGMTGLSSALLLPEKPSSITSITENGTTLQATDYVVDYSAGIVYRGSTVWPLHWQPGRSNIVVTYAVGSAVIPPNVTLAAREELRFLWQNGQQGGARPSFGDTPNYEQMAFTPSGYTVPNRVAGLLSAAESAQVAWFG